MKFITCAFGLMLVVACSASAQFSQAPMIEFDAVERAVMDTSINTMEGCLARNFGETTCEFLFQARSVMRSLRVPTAYAVEIDPVVPGLTRFLLLKVCPLGKSDAVYVNGWCVHGEETFPLKLTYWSNQDPSAVREIATGFTTYVHQNFFYHILHEEKMLTPQGREALGM